MLRSIVYLPMLSAAVPRVAASWRWRVANRAPRRRNKKEAGDITGALVLFHDITELKKIDQVRWDFVANVSHELRTPLSILRGYIETLLDSPEIARGTLPNPPSHGTSFEAPRLLAEDLLTPRNRNSQSSFAIGRRRSIELLQRDSRFGKEAREQTAPSTCRCLAGLAPDFTLTGRDPGGSLQFARQRREILAETARSG